MFKEEKSKIEMSKELIELNSIEIIKNMFIDYDKNFEYYGDFPTLNLERKKAIETILNILENQKAEIEKNKLKEIDLQDKIWDLEAERDKTRIACYLSEKENQAIIENNNRLVKVIHLMASHIKHPKVIFTGGRGHQHIIEYFEKKAEEDK